MAEKAIPDELFTLWKLGVTKGVAVKCRFSYTPLPRLPYKGAILLRAGSLVSRGLNGLLIVWI